MSELLLILVAGIVVTAGYVYWFYERCFSYWKERGVAGPKPIIPMGNMHTVMKKSWDQLYNDWMKCHGETFGIFEGWRPVLVITKPEDVKDVTVKSFHKFINRRYLGGDNDGRKILFFRDDDDWKRMRTVMSPAFSSGKMKLMYPLMLKCLSSFMNHVDQMVNNGAPISCKKLYGKLTSCVIARCAFATEIDPYSDENNVIYQKLCKFFDFGIVRSLLLACGPQWLNTWLKLTFPDPDSVWYLNEMCKSVVTQRKSQANSAQFVDLLQSLIDAGKKSEASTGDSSMVTDHESHHSVDEKMDTSKLNLEMQGQFTETEIASNLILFFAAGYETTSNVLNLSTFYLVQHPSIQEKLYQSIKQIYTENDGQLDYDTLTSMQYLDAFISEVMRIQPSVLRVERIASQDHTLASGVKIEKGCLVQIPIYPIHRNEKYHDDPDTFNPDRFLPENRGKIISGSYLPFLIGPRNCIGMRFALIEAKMTLAHLLIKYKFTQTEETVKELTGEPLNPIFVVKDELVVKFVTRD